MNEVIALIHGMGRTRRSMRSLANYCRQHGYQVINQGYNSYAKPIEQLAEEHIPSILEELSSQDYRAIHFVTHSLGGIMLRYYLSRHQIERLGKIVMIAPPNQGSEVAERFRHSLWYKLATGKPGQQLYMKDNPLLQNLKPITTQLGILIGTRSSDPWFNHLFESKHDGKVSVESAKLPEMNDFLTVDDGHTFIMNKRYVQQQILHFIRAGHFEHTK